MLLWWKWRLVGAVMALTAAVGAYYYIRHDAAQEAVEQVRTEQIQQEATDYKETTKRVRNAPISSNVPAAREWLREFSVD